MWKVTVITITIVVSFLTVYIGYFCLTNVLGFALLMAVKEIIWSGAIGIIIFMCKSRNAGTDFTNKSKKGIKT